MKSLQIKEIVEKLASLENPANVAGMTRFGIVTKKAFGVSAPELKLLAKEIKKLTANLLLSTIHFFNFLQIWRRY